MSSRWVCAGPTGLLESQGVGGRAGCTLPWQAGLSAMSWRSTRGAVPQGARRGTPQAGSRALWGEG